MQGWLRRVGNWFTHVWRDPVWSKLIAEALKWLAGNWPAVIGAATALVGFGSLFSKRLAVVWDSLAMGLGSLLGWLTGSVTVPRLLVGIALIILGAVGWSLRATRSRHRREVAQLKTDGEALLREGIALAAKKASNETMAVVNAVMAKPTAKPEPSLPPVSGLHANHVRVLRMLYKEYRDGIEIEDIAQLLSIRYPKAEKMCDDLATTKLVNVSSRDYDAPAAFLTKLGRDYCITNGLDR